MAHVQFYLKVIADFTDGKPGPRLGWKQSWLVNEVTESRWDSLRQELQDSYAHATVQLRSIIDWNGARRLGGVMAMRAHTAYYLGAIRQEMHVRRRTWLKA